MFTTMEERARNLDKHMLKMQAHMCEKASLKAEDLQPVGIPSPETVWVCGRICCEAETGKINSQAVMLEGSRRESGGRRVKLDLGQGRTDLALPDRIAAGQTKLDPALSALLFQFGRHLLVSSSRPGGLPANLQGIWAQEYATPWNGDYHLDINVQMNYWLADVANLGECFQPYSDWVQSIRAVRIEKTMKELKMIWRTL
jgi:hypothetical protein